MLTTEFNELVIPLLSEHNTCEKGGFDHVHRKIELQLPKSTRSATSLLPDRGAINNFESCMQSSLNSITVA